MILVDEPRIAGGWARMTSSVSAEELHLFADRIGLGRGWYKGPHYDLTASARTRALGDGAKAVSADELDAACYAQAAKRRKRGRA